MDTDNTSNQHKDFSAVKIRKKIHVNKSKAFTSATVIWSGHGYHIYLPVEAFLLEEESEFARFGYPSRKFIQFSEEFLSDNKAYPCHTEGLSFKNCMLRIPGSINSKRSTKKSRSYENGMELDLISNHYYLDLTFTF